MDILDSIKLIIGKVTGTTNPLIDYIDVENVEVAINTDRKFADLKDYIFKRDNNECKKCSLPKNLVVHQTKKNQIIYSKNLITLCYWCDLEAHGEKLFDSREMSRWGGVSSSAYHSSSRHDKDDNYIDDSNEEKRKKSWTFDFNSQSELDGEWEYLRDAVFKRDGYRCTNCEFTKNLIVHHITPRYAGGADELSNLRTLCASCHDEVHNRKIFKEEKVFTRHQKTYEPSPKVQALNLAISSKDSILINYTDEKGITTHREIEPFKIFEEHGILYVRANCLLRNAERTFRISRINLS